MSIDTRPFHPLADHVVNPYDLFEPHSYRDEPLIGLDGGIILPKKTIEQVRQPALKEYLSRRLGPTGKVYAVTHVNGQGDDELSLHMAKNGEMLTSRGPDYFRPNVRFNDMPKEARAGYLYDNLEMDRLLAEQWSEAVESLQSDVSPEDAFRVIAAVLQNITADLIGVDYAANIAQLTAPKGMPADGTFSEAVFNTATDYYRSLMSNGITPIIQEQLLEGVTEEARRILVKAVRETPLGVNNIRTRRETDCTYLTLAAAKTFINEFGPDVSVIVPRLGGYDLGPALRALGFNGNIMYITPNIKTSELAFVNDQDLLKRHSSEPTDIFNQLGHSGYEDEFIIFDDSLGSGSTLRSILSAIVPGAQVNAIRTMFQNTQREDGKCVAEALGDKGISVASYFELPFKPSGNQKQFLVPSRFSELWHQQT